MTRDDVLDLIASHGASRWPEAVRDEALALVAGDAELRAAFEDAARLDALLDGWAARTPVTDGAAVAARILRPAARWPRFAGAGLAAAAVAALVMVSPPGRAPVAPAPIVADAADDAAAFATLFTPTPDEETLI